MFRATKPMAFTPATAKQWAESPATWNALNSQVGPPRPAIDPFTPSWALPVNLERLGVGGGTPFQGFPAFNPLPYLDR